MIFGFQQLLENPPLQEFANNIIDSLAGMRLVRVIFGFQQLLENPPLQEFANNIIDSLAGMRLVRDLGKNAIATKP